MITFRPMIMANQVNRKLAFASAAPAEKVQERKNSDGQVELLTSLTKEVKEIQFNKDNAKVIRFKHAVSYTVDQNSEKAAISVEGGIISTEYRKENKANSGSYTVKVMPLDINEPDIVIEGNIGDKPERDKAVRNFIDSIKELNNNTKKFD